MWWPEGCLSASVRPAGGFARGAAARRKERSLVDTMIVVEIGEEVRAPPNRLSMIRRRRAGPIIRTSRSAHARLTARCRRTSTLEQAPERERWSPWLIAGENGTLAPTAPFF